MLNETFKPKGNRRIEKYREIKCGKFMSHCFLMLIMFLLIKPLLLVQQFMKVSFDLNRIIARLFGDNTDQEIS